MVFEFFCVSSCNVGKALAVVGREAVGADRWAFQAVGKLGILGPTCLYGCRRRNFSFFCGDYWPSDITCINLPHCRRHCCCIPFCFLVFRIYSSCTEVA